MTDAPSAPQPLLPLIQVEHFRAFRDRAELELRPLTLLYGRNQVGKSTLLRLLVLLADSTFGRVPALDLHSDALLGATFKELGWLGPEPSSSPSIRVGAPGRGPYLELHLTDDNGLVPNRVHIGEGDSPEFSVSFAGGSARAPQSFAAAYEGENAGEAWAGNLTFDNLLPLGVHEFAARRLERVREALQPLRRLQWLATSQAADRRVFRPSRVCRPDGSDLAQLLGNRKPLLDGVSRWIEGRPELDESVSVIPDSTGEPRFSLRRAGGESLPLYLAGEGMRWLLPILLVAEWAASDSADRPTMLAVEEPESRLHPSLQIALFERLLGLLDSGVPSVLETHSIYLLRRMQLAVAEGKLRPKDVALYWVHRSDDGFAASLKQIQVESDGTLRGWQAGTFEEEQTLARRIFQARWAAKGDS